MYNINFKKLFDDEPYISGRVMKYIDLDFVKPNKDCTQGCDNITDNAYVCFECEDIQIKKKYPNAIYNDDCEWIIDE